MRKNVERRYVSLSRTYGGGADPMKIEYAELNEAFGNGSEVLPVNAECFEGLETTKFEQIMRECYGKGGG